MDKVDVIIPARNEEDTIGPVIEAFRAVEYVGNIIVVSNGNTPFPTADVAAGFGAFTRQDASINGKGEAIALGLEWVKTQNVVLCDGDLTGLTPTHVRQFTCVHCPKMTIGVPDWPGVSPVPWAVRMDIFAQMSGQRCLPTSLLRSVPLFGYTVEAFLNRAADIEGLPVTYIHLEGVKGKIRQNKLRMEELRRDREWMKTHWKEGA